METIDMYGQKHRINYRKLRITQIVNLRDTNRLLVKAYFRIPGGKANIVGIIPYQAFVANSESMSKADVAVEANKVIKTVIANLPVGIPAAQLSLFERNMLTAVCRTLVMSNPDLPLRCDRPQSATANRLVAHMEVAGVRGISLPKAILLNELGIDEETLDKELDELEERHLVSTSEFCALDRISVYPAIMLGYYTITANGEGKCVSSPDIRGFVEYDGDDVNEDEDWDSSEPKDPVPPDASPGAENNGADSGNDDMGRAIFF